MRDDKDAKISNESYIDLNGKKKILTRTRSSGDKRKIYVTLNEEQIKVYEDEHERILKIVDKLIERVGKENAQKALELFELIAHIAKEEIK